MSDLTISTYKEAEGVLRRPDLKQAHYDEGAILMAKVLVNLHGDEHRTRRNVESKIFRRDVFRHYEKTVFPQTLRETISPIIAKGEADLVDLMYRVLLNLTADFAGIDRPERSAAETATLLRLLRTFGKAATLAQAVGDKEAIRAEIQSGLDEFDRDFFMPSMERRRDLVAAARRGEVAEEDLPRDVLTVLLRHEDVVNVSHDVLMKEMAFFLLAGAFTSVHSTTHSVHELCEWRTAHPEAAERLADPLFVQRCVHESMRLHPSSPVARRRPTEPTELPGGARLMPSDIVVLDLLSANRDPSVFGDDATVYNPLRDKMPTNSPYGLSFGYGPHACIGRNLAAGVLPGADTDRDEHHYGTVALTVLELLSRGIRPDPDNPPRMDTSTTRPNWAHYPVVFEKTTEGVR